MAFPQTIVYILKSSADPARYYTGLTSNLAARLNAHNAGRVPHTADGKPWAIDVVVEFHDERRAVAFEKYLNPVPATHSPGDTSGECGHRAGTGDQSTGC